MLKKLALLLIFSISIFSLFSQADSRYDAGMNLPFNEKAGDVNPQTGAISVSEGDVSLPGRAGVNFSFGRSWNINQASVYDMSFDPATGENVLAGNSIAKQNRLGIGWSTSLPYILKDTSSGQLVMTMFVNGQAYELDQEGLRLQPSASRSNILGYDLVDKRVDASSALGYSDFTGLNSTALAAYNAQATGRSAYVLTLTDNSKYYFTEAGQLMCLTDKTGLNSIWYFYNAQSQLVLVYDTIGREITFSYDGDGNLAEISYDVSVGKKDDSGNRQRVSETRTIRYEYERISESELPEINPQTIHGSSSAFRLIRVVYPENMVKEYAYETKPFVFSFNGQFHVTNYSALLTSISDNVNADGNYSSKREFFYEPMKGPNYKKPLYNGFMEYFKISKQHVRNRHGNVMSPVEYRYYDEGEQQLYRKYASEVQIGNVLKRYIYRLEGNPGKDHVLLETQTTTGDGFIERSISEYTDDRRILRKKMYRGQNDVLVYTERFNYNKKGQLLDSTNRLGLETETVYHDTFGMPVLELVYIPSENQTLKTTHVIDEQYGYVLESYVHTTDEIIRIQKVDYDVYGNVAKQTDMYENTVEFVYDDIYNAFPVKTFSPVTIREYESADFASNWGNTPQSVKVEARKYQVFNSDGSVWIEVDNDGYAIEHYYDALGAEIETVIPDANDIRDASYEPGISDLESSEYWNSFLESRSDNPGTRILFDRTNALVREMSDVDREEGIYLKTGQQGDGLGNIESNITYYGNNKFKRQYTQDEIDRGVPDLDWDEYSRSISVFDNQGRRIAITDVDFNEEAGYSIQNIHGIDVHVYDKTWLIYYDDLDRQSMVQYPDTGNGHSFKFFQYDDVENSITIIDAENRKSYSKSDWAGNILETIVYGDYLTRDHEIQKFYNEYDESGRLQKSIDPMGLETGYDYDERNLRIFQWYDFEHIGERMSYDKRGLLIYKEDRKGQIVTFKYDELARVTQVKHYIDSDALLQNSPSRVVESDYDRRGNTIRVESDSLIEYYEYDHGSRVSRLSRKLKNAEVESKISPVWLIDNDNNIFTFEYAFSDGGLLQEIKYPDGTIHEYNYKKDIVNIDSIKTGLDDVSMENFVFGFKYNKAGVTTHMQWANGTSQNWEFDNRKRIQHLQIKNSTDIIDELTFKLNNNGDIIGINASEYEYDGFNRIIGAKTELPENKSQNYSTLVEEYFGAVQGSTEIPYIADADRFPIDQPDGRIDGADVMQAYQDMKDIDPDMLFDIEDFSYDQNGNRTTLTQNGNLYRYEYGKRNRLTSVYLTKKDSDFEQLFIEYEYDENGNTTKRIIYRDNETETISFSYDTLNRLLRTDKSIVSDNPDENESSFERYLYDNAGNRFIKMTSSGKATLYLRHGQIAVAMDIEIPADDDSSSVGTINRYILCEDLLAGRISKTYKVDDTGTVDYQEKRSYYHLDHLNSTKTITDENGALEAKYIYRAFGEQLRKLGDGDAVYTYTGKELDTETNLYYFNARFYDATIGRFINVDPVQDGTNWYIYVNNNPLNMIDPTGLEFIFKPRGGLTEDDPEYLETVAAFQELCKLDNEVGRRMKAIADAPEDDIKVIILIRSEDSLNGFAGNGGESAVNGKGQVGGRVSLHIGDSGDSDYYEDLKTVIVHEVAGHVWDDLQGNGTFGGSNNSMDDLRRSEQNAVAITNFYRFTLGKEQRTTYEHPDSGSWDMPTYNGDGTWSIIHGTVGADNVYTQNDKNGDGQPDPAMPWTHQTNLPKLFYGYE